MRLNLSRRQKMNCSTMFKRLPVLAVLLWLISAVLVQAEEEREYLPAGEAEILLVHNESPSDDEAEDIEYISMLANALNRSLDFGTPEQCADIVSKYSYIICYGLDEVPGKFMEELGDYDGSLMVLGSAFMEKYLTETGQAAFCAGRETQEKGKLEYCFSEENRFEELVEIRGMRKFLEEGYTNGEITAGNKSYPFCSQVGNVRFIPVTDFSGSLARAALMQEIVQWMWPYLDSPPDYAQYFVLDKVYPFMSAEKLKERVDILIESGIPFVISVMPVLQNTEFPSMKQFCQVLSYAQANGGAVILNAPVIHKADTDIDELYEKLTDMTVAYTDYGVYPLGIEVPLSWTNDETYLKVLQRYRTVFVCDDGSSSGFDLDSHKNSLYYNYHQLVLPLIGLDKTGTSYLKCYSSALYLDSCEETGVLEEKIKNCRESSVPFKNLWDMNHSVWANDFWMNYEDRILSINGKEAVIEFQPEAFDEDFDYGRNIIQRITVSLQNQNKILMVLVAAIVVIFVSFIIYARKRNRRNFFFDDKRE